MPQDSGHGGNGNVRSPHDTGTSSSVPNNGLGSEDHAPEMPQPPSSSPVSEIGGWSVQWSNLRDPIRTIRTSDGALDSDRGLSGALVRALGLTDAEKLAAEEALRNAFSLAEELLRKNAVAESSEDNTDTDNFRVTADLESAEAIISGLHEELSEVIGPERGTDVLNAIPLHKYYGGFGLLDGRIWFQNRVLKPDSFPPSLPVRLMHFELTDPLSGERRVSGTHFFNSMSKHFGDAFQLSDE
ncbi:hypothetical protein BH23VER1_BH23VER1_21790 [soil metagenome]